MSGATSPEAETIIRQTQQINTLMDQSASRIDRVQKSLDGAWAAQQRFEQAQNAINSATERGRITQERANQLLDLNKQRLEQATRATQGLAAANDNASRRGQNFGQQIGQIGFQVQDFAVQVASGQSALTAFAQQAPQALGAFGTVGILAGVAIAIGAVVVKLFDATAAQRAFDDALKAAGDTYSRNTQLADRWREGLETERNRIRDLTNAYEAMNVAGREYERRRLEETRGTLRTQQQGMERNTERELQDLRRVIDRQIEEARNATLRARQFDRNAPAVSVDPGIRQGVEALTALGAPGERTAQQVEEVARRLAEASQNAGPFAEILRDTAGALDRLIPGWRTLSEAVQRNQADLDANAQAAQRAGQSINGLGGNAAGAAGQVDGLTASVARLRAQTDTLVGIENTAGIARAEQRAAALARGLGAARTFDAAEAQRQSSERYFTEQRRQDEERLRSERYSNDQIREELARTDEARRQSSNRRAELEAGNAARLRALEEAERNGRRGAAAGERAAAREQKVNEREQRETDRLISSLDGEAAATIRLRDTHEQLAEARRRGFITEGQLADYSRRAEEDANLARQRANALRIQALDKSELDAERTKRVAELTSELGSIMGETFRGLVREGKSFSDVLDNIQERLLRLGDKMLLEPLLQQIAQLGMSALGGGGGMGGGMGGILGTLLGSAGGAEIAGTGMAKAAEVAMSAAVLHDGGIAGRDGGRRLLPAEVFLDSPRYHSGAMAGGMPFANDEVPAVLKKREVVLTEGQQGAVRRAMGGMTINAPLIVRTEDPGAFNRTRSQIAREQRRAINRASRSA